MVNKAIFFSVIVLISIIFSCCQGNENESVDDLVMGPESIIKPPLKFGPEKYICYTTDELTIDGLLLEDEWTNANWTSGFSDIEGNLNEKPLHNTRVKMLWDENYLYIAAEIEEPHIWAYLQQRDTVIFYDNDFEIFIDPDGDTHGYYEFEINALNTIWDLLLIKPYRDGGRAINAWDIKGIKTAVKIYGTLNDPADIDEKWIIELAFPFKVLKEWGTKPADGLQWRINFSRVNWRTIIENGKYIKEKNTETGRNLPEFNWVWSPQGVINMHYPEMWGYVQFSSIQSGKGKARFMEDPDEIIKWRLRTLYYSQREFISLNNRYTEDLAQLESLGYEPSESNPVINITPSGYQATIKSSFTGLLWIIDNTGRIYPIE